MPPLTKPLVAGPFPRAAVPIDLTDRAGRRGVPPTGPGAPADPPR